MYLQVLFAVSFGKPFHSWKGFLFQFIWHIQPISNMYDDDPILWIRDHCPFVSVIGLSTLDNENTIVRMLKSGVSGYILNKSDPDELKFVFETIQSKGYHFSDRIINRSLQSLHLMHRQEWKDINPALSTMEKQFLKLAGTEMTYKEIAAAMRVGTRTIDGTAAYCFPN